MHHARSLRTAAILAPLCFAACAEEGEPTVDAGDLRMGVVGQDGGGLYYRLRDAVFAIEGPMSTAVGTEENPTTDVISVELPAGAYEVLLEDGWRLERWDPITDATLAVDATLTSGNPASTVVSGSETSTVVFVFEVPDAGPVVLGDGDLEIDIDVETTPPLTTCDPLVQDCANGEGCYPTTDGAFCAPSGDVPLYGACTFLNACSGGHTCVLSSANVNCNPSSEGCCVALCSVSFPSCSGFEICASLDIENPEVGVCASF